jgi:hypothetical protein
VREFIAEPICLSYSLKVRVGYGVFQMSSDTLTGEVIPLATAEEPPTNVSEQIKVAAGQPALDRNYQLIDSFIHEKWPETADA